MGVNPLALAASFFLLFLWSAYAFAASPNEETPLLLEIWINGHTKHVIIEAVQRKSQLLVDSVTLASAGIKFTPKEVRSDGLIAADALPGVTMVLDSNDMKLKITATQERLQAQLFELNTKQKSNVTSSGTGFIGQYDLIGTVDDFNKSNESTTTGAVLGGTYFTPDGNLSSNQLLERQNGLQHSVRFDTSFERDDPDEMRRFVAGDSITGSQTWSRSVRFGGFQMATDFTLRPDISTMPLPAFFGQSAVPANVDVFVNAAKVFEGGVDPGAFQINNLPVITGSGEASMVVRNALGQETVVTVPFYASNQLLREGLSSYDIDGGFLRTQYGVESFGYSDPVMTGTYSYGAKNWLTLEGHSEAAKHIQLAGGGTILSLSPYGTLHLASAISRRDDNEISGLGALHSVSVESEIPPVGFFGSVNATTGHYADIASIGGTTPPQLQAQIGSHASLGEYGSVAGSYIDIHRDNQQDTRLTTFSYTRSFDNRWNFGATGFYDMTHNETVMEAFLSFSLSNGMIADSNVQTGNKIHQQQVELTKPTNPYGGFGYHLANISGDNRDQQAEATWIGQHGSIDATLDNREGQQAGRITASGGIVVMGDEIYATKRQDGSVALVQTGAPGTSIYQENRPVATADENGKALITGLVPFSENHLSIDPSQYKLSTLVGAMDKTVTPGRQSGVIVDFTPENHSPAVVLLRMADGSYPQVVSRVFLKGSSEPLVVGRHGEMFIEDLNEPIYGIIDNGSAPCHFAVNPPQSHGDIIPRIGTVTCIPDQAAP